jgi:hypothetical protein
MLVSYTEAPRIGHFNPKLHIFVFLHHHPRSRLVFNDGYPIIETTPDEDWNEFYPGAKEDIPPNAAKPLGKPLIMFSYCDTDHSGDLLKRCSCTGVLIFLNRSPTLWYSKKQACIETSNFGSEFMGLKTATDLVKGLQYC